MPFLKHNDDGSARKALAIPESWREMEETVRETVFEARDAARAGGELRQFYLDLRTASAELFKLGDQQNVEYSVPRMGEAYALWYHMRRVANAYDALQAFTAEIRAAFWSSKPWRVLDVGSGTGAVEMALTRWLVDHDAEAETDPFGTCTVTCIEPSAEMAAVSRALLDRFARRLDRDLDVEVHTCALEDWVPENGQEFDLIVFSTTFDYLTGEARRSMKRTVTELVGRHLTDWGVVLFIVPKGEGSDPQSKWSFVQELREELKIKGGLSWRRRDEAASPLAPSDAVQKVVLDARERLYAEARALSPPVSLYRCEPASMSEREQPRYCNDVFPFALRLMPKT
ncbi:MAG TPA: class I SAM-dependent methyltransferase [Longimicrobium sp.]|jgi:SAM-dependent methyltransferase|nr:class I SAM-dependent methyltransferase [Longimicrobium sp.]